MSVDQIITDVNSYIEENLDEEFEGLGTDLAEVTDFPELIQELVELANEGMKEYTKVAMENQVLGKNIKILEKLCEEHSIEALLDTGIAYQKQVKDLQEENKKLKEKTTEHLGMAETLHDAVVKENKKLKEENKKLKEEMKKLKEEEETDDDLKNFLERQNISEDDLKELMEDCEGRICPEESVESQ